MCGLNANVFAGGAFVADDDGANSISLNTVSPARCHIIYHIFTLGIKLISITAQCV